jgi:hypothetical protein
MTNFQHNLILGKSCNEHDRSLKEGKETWRKCVQKVWDLRVSMFNSSDKSLGDKSINLPMNIFSYKPIGIWILYTSIDCQ